MARMEAKWIGGFAALAGLGALAYMLWPKRASASEPTFPPGGGLSTQRQGTPTSRPASTETQIRNALIGTGVTAGVGLAAGGVKAGIGAVASLFGGGGAPATTAAAAASTAAAGSIGTEGATLVSAGAAGLAVVAVGAAAAAGMVVGFRALSNQIAYLSDRAESAYSVKLALDTTAAEALHNGLSAAGYKPMEIAALEAEWICTMSNYARAGTYPFTKKFAIDASFITARCARGSAARNALPANAPQWIDMVGGTLQAPAGKGNITLTDEAISVSNNVPLVSRWKALNPGAPYTITGFVADAAGKIVVQRFTNGGLQMADGTPARVIEDYVAAGFPREQTTAFVNHFAQGQYLSTPWYSIRTFTPPPPVVTQDFAPIAL